MTGSSSERVVVEVVGGGCGGEGLCLGWVGGGGERGGAQKY